MAYVIASVASADIFCRKLGFDGLGAKAVRQAWTCKRRHRIPSPVCQAATHREANDADIDLSNGALSMCRVVLVSPQRPGNVGAVARLCANHGEPLVRCAGGGGVHVRSDICRVAAAAGRARGALTGRGAVRLQCGGRLQPSRGSAAAPLAARASAGGACADARARGGRGTSGARRGSWGRARGGARRGRGRKSIAVGRSRATNACASVRTRGYRPTHRGAGHVQPRVRACDRQVAAQLDLPCIAPGSLPLADLSQACAVALSRLYEGVASPPPPPPPPPLRQLSTTHDSISTANGARATLPEDADEVGRPTNAPALPGSMAPHPRSAAYRSLPGSATLAEVDAVIRRWDQLVSASADLIQWAGNDASSAAGTATPGRPSTPSSGSPPAGNPSGTTPAASRAQAGPGRLGPVADASGVDTVGGDVPPEEFEGRGYQRAAGTVDAAVGSRNDMGATSHRAGSESGGVKTGGGKDPARQGGARIAGGNAGDDTFSDRFVPQMRRLLLRANASKRELQFLHGFFSLVQQALAAQQVPR
eukprot:jgi/Mesvir1/25121/Mv21581-RA.2